MNGQYCLSPVPTTDIRIKPTLRSTAETSGPEGLHFAKLQTHQYVTMVTAFSIASEAPARNSSQWEMGASSPFCSATNVTGHSHAVCREHSTHLNYTTTMQPGIGEETVGITQSRGPGCTEIPGKVLRKAVNM
jgi:hypothetical protein